MALRHVVPLVLAISMLASSTACESLKSRSRDAGDAVVYEDLPDADLFSSPDSADAGLYE